MPVLIDEISFALSSAVVHAATNLDNLLVLVAMSAGIGPQRAGAAYLAAQAGILLAAFVLGLSAAALVTAWVGLLGLLPIGLGLRALFAANGEGPATPVSCSLWVGTAIFLSLSTDTLAVFTAIFADSIGHYRSWAMIGAVLSAIAVVSLSMGVVRRSMSAQRLALRGERFIPFVMIGVGIYVLANSWTDLSQ